MQATLTVTGTVATFEESLERLEVGWTRAAAGGEGVAYQSHCQHRTLGLEGYTEAVLERLGYDVLTSDTECCGMAGSFGYKSQYYDLSVDVGAELKRQFRTEEARDRTVVASGRPVSTNWTPC